MKYIVKYEVKDVEKTFDKGLSSFIVESELDAANLKVKLKSWFNLPTDSTTLSEELLLNGKELLDTDTVPFRYSSLSYKLVIKTPFSVKKELRQESVKESISKLQNK